MKELYTGKDGLNPLLEGARKLHDAVSVTLGPKGKNVIITTGGVPVVTHDGVTVARSLDLKDPKEQAGAELLKQAATNSDRVGDGTTTTTVLSYALLKEAIDSAAAPMQLSRELRGLLPKLLTTLDDLSVDGHLEAAANISAADPDTGKIVADIAREVGPDGVISVEPSDGTGLTYDVTKGFKFDRGYFSPYFVTDHLKQEAAYEDISVLILGDPLTDLDMLAPILELSDRKLLIITPECQGTALPALVKMKLQGYYSPLVVKAPFFGVTQTNALEDIAALTGATLVDDLKSNLISPDVLGKVRKVLATVDTTTLIADSATERVAELTAQLDTLSGYEKEAMQERIARLTGKAAVIRVGAPTEAQARELQYRVEDAVGAAQAALRAGVVPGGGTTLLELSRGLGETLPEKILATALKAPFKQLLQNAGLPYNEDIKPGFGFDVNTGEQVELLPAGIVDPTQVVKEALTNAVNVAATIITTGAVIAEELEED